MTWPHAILTVLLLGLNLYVLCNGDRYERLLAGALLADGLVKELTQNRVDFGAVQYGWLIGDSVLLAGVVAICVVSQKRWALVGAAFQIVTVYYDALRIFDKSADPWTYITYLIIVCAGLPIAMFVGVLLRTHRAVGADLKGRI